MSAADPNRAPHLELILQQVASLPTLPEVAMRLLRLTSDEASDAKDVIELVRGDQALTARVLALCRRADRGIAEPVTTVDRAVVLLGFAAIRNAVLSIEVFESFPEVGAAGAPQAGPRSESGAGAAPPVGFDRAGFWRHCLGVAIASEMIASRHEQQIRPHRPAEAFVCGLLHDIGKLALDHLLPRSFQRVIELTEQHHLNIAEVERRVIGLDHHTVGKRLAEHWKLPHLLQDCIWLHGAPPQSLPDLPHRPMIEIVTVADLLVRRHHLGYSGNHDAGEPVERRAERAGLRPEHVAEVAETLHEELERRAEALGLGQAPSRKLFLESIMRANAVLGRMNERLESGRRQTARQSRALEAIVRFHSASCRPGRGLADVMSDVVGSAASVLGRGYYGILYQRRVGQPWLLSEYDDEGRALSSRFIEPPEDAPELGTLIGGSSLSMRLMAVLPWIAEHLLRSVDARGVHLLPLPCGWGTAGVMLHEQPRLPDAGRLEALVHTWGAAIGAAAQYQGARRLAERLVEAGREVAQMQEELLHKRSLARLGEMAAGAAHEMNNPLAVISGRAQLLTNHLPAGTREQQHAELIWRQSERLSELITALRLFAEPPRPSIVDVTVAGLTGRAVELMRQRQPQAPAPEVHGADGAPPLRTDPEHAAAALAELLLNAVQAGGEGPVRIRPTVDRFNNRLLLQVVDNGPGMDQATLEHAFNPFFSAKPAGRRAGLGLARAQRLAEVLGGGVELSSQPGSGTMATLVLPLNGEPAPDRSRGRATTEGGSEPWSGVSEGESRAISGPVRQTPGVEAAQRGSADR